MSISSGGGSSGAGGRGRRAGGGGGRGWAGRGCGGGVRGEVAVRVSRRSYLPGRAVGTALAVSPARDRRSAGGIGGGSAFWRGEAVGLPPAQPLVWDAS